MAKLNGDLDPLWQDLDWYVPSRFCLSASLYCLSEKLAWRLSDSSGRQADGRGSGFGPCGPPAEAGNPVLLRGLLV